MKSNFSEAIYPTINHTDINWGLVITTIGFQSIPPHSHYPSKDHPSSYLFHPQIGRTLNEYQIMYITKGKGVFASKHFNKLKIEAGTMIFLFPSEWHTFSPNSSTGWDSYWIGFKGNFANNLIQHNFFSKEQPIKEIGFIEQMITLYKQAIFIADQEKTSFQQALSGIAINILGLTYYTLKNNLFTDDRIVKNIQKAQFIMREHPEKDIAPVEIASSINMSYSWFRRMFKKYTGLSPAQYQLQIRIQKAKELLTNSTIPIKEIASILNFTSYDYFISSFKSKTGETPAEFRNKSHNQKSIPKIDINHLLFIFYFFWSSLSFSL